MQNKYKIYLFVICCNKTYGLGLFLRIKSYFTEQYLFFVV